MAPENSTLSLSDRLTTQFYSWERRGRGWQVWPESVDIEPPWQPFSGHYVPENLVDDGRRPTVLSSLFGGLRSLVTSSPAPISSTPPEEEPEPIVVRESAGIIEWQITLPADFDISCRLFETFLISISYCRHPVSIEFVSNAELIRLFMSADSDDALHIEHQLTAHFPEAVVSRIENGLVHAFDEVEGGETLAVDFGLSREFMLPIQTHAKGQTDSLLGLIAALSHLREGELSIFQVIWKPVEHAWGESILRAVTFNDGSPFFDDAPEFLKLVKEKISRPLFAAVVRIAVVCPDEKRMWELARELTAGLIPFANRSGNEFIPLENDGYDDAEHFSDVLYRRSHRSGMILSSEELVSLVHLPTRDVKSAKFARVVKKTKAAPAAVFGHPLKLGINTHNGKKTRVSLSAEDRVRHMHVIGASGTGKSTFLLNLIMQDIEQGNGLGVLDPHGDLIDQIISRIPTSRINDVVLVDPGDADFPIGFNILNAHSDLEKTLLASDLVGIFRRFATSWGDQMGSVLGNAVLAYLESTKGGTLSDLRRFLIEPQYRNEFLSSVSDPEIVYYWRKEFPLLAGSKSIGPLLTRLDTFLRPKPVRYMVSQQRNSLDISHIMDTRKILLCKLGQGAIGEENAYLLGSLIVSKFHQLTLGRQAQSESTRTPFTLYCDEFGGYVTPSMSRLLSGARKYRLGLVLSHQDMRQITDPDVQSSLSNAATRISFRVGDADAKSLGSEFSSFTAEDLKNLQTGEAIAKVGISQDDFNLQTEMLPEANPEEAEQTKAAIIQLTHAKYATPRKQVEEQLARSKEAAPVTPVSKQPERTEERKAPAPEILGKVEEEVPEVEVKQTVPPTPAVKKVRMTPPVVADMGKGGREHKYFQNLLAQWAQGMGYRATIEMPTPHGAGSIDVVLEKESRRIACEISVTSTVEQEVGNLKKCLSAGFTDVYMICAETKTLSGLKKAAEGAIEAKMLAGVKFVAPDELFSSAELLQAGEKKEEMVRGYKVKVRLKSVDDAEANERRRAVGRVLMRGRGKTS